MNIKALTLFGLAAIIAAGVGLVLFQLGNGMADTREGINATQQYSEVYTTQKFSDFTIETIDGQTIALKDLQGKYVIIWLMLPVGCPTCVYQAGEIKDFIEEYGGDEVVVIAVSVLKYQGVEDNIREFLEKNGMPGWIAAIDNQGLGVKFEIPEMGVVVLGPDGSVIYKGVPSASSEELARALDMKPLT
ncbi:TlpA family protein disulfide reductase [Aeropyrum camini]|uniref:Thiol-disulfide isomerase and thioredoxin n=1 Tax=Aeropyrum camini SY1 = JCM 12091 TaxID=1198449 RepID=U3TDP5_9CREN|nr:TlpA disulfide reductase family protein [Aeropyrum camini]BAN89484.1 thiol-disulfide isomerase and thioredoxin [Aeropyrum camini SY1 = JCM 12091]